MKIISRAEAKAAALKRYFTGSPCKYGHVAERSTVNGLCLECGRLKTQKAYHENREENLRKQKIRRDSNPNHAAEQRARSHARDPELARRAGIKRRNIEARDKARAAGEPQYLSERPCPRGHIGMRFVHDSHCVACNKINCKLRYRALPSDPERAARKLARQIAIAEKRKLAAARKARRIEASKRWRALCSARQTAFANGSKTYVGSPCSYGHQGRRYTAGGGCIECSAIYMRSDERKAYDAAYVQRNLPRILERSKEYHRRNPERVAARAREWAQRNPEKIKAIKMANKAKRRAIEKDGDPTSVIFAWAQAAKKICYWCGVPCKRKYHVDHYKPLSKGGKHEVPNLVIACPHCNLTKSAKDPYAFAASMGRLF
ncbi:HNH endonuclease [Paraburkholderia tropica]|uniref:HNH endonuclease n=1 Tax=Paraburkholderia tropica TaxID=92647 RepID=UPI002AB6E160|nr:HNH endonuclease signature motif containing protein [Paraburkholderia tropica]